MPQLFTNLARALLTAGITDAATSLTVESLKADLFPVANTGTDPVPATTDWFKATLQDASGVYEIVYVRTRAAASGVFSNVIRGREGTVARAWGPGTVVGLRITAEDVQNSIAAASAAVLITGNQTIAGTKTFQNEAIFSAGLQGNVTGNVTGNAGTVTNGVYTSGDQTIGGIKTFSASPVVPTLAEKIATTQAATAEFVDRLRSLTTPTTGASGTLVIGDRGSMVEATGGITVPNGVFAKRDVVTILNVSASPITITQGASFTLYNAATGATGNRTLAARGMATIVFTGGSAAHIGGAGLT